MGTTIGGFDVSSGERVWSDVDANLQAAFWQDVKPSSVWKRFVKEFGNTPSNNRRVFTVIQKLHGDAPLTTGRFLDGLTVAINAGELERKPESHTPAPTPTPTVQRPRDPNGRFLSAEEVFAEWANDPNRSMSEVRKRAHADHAFGAWFRRAYSEQTMVDGGLHPLNAPSRPAADPNSPLAVFARLYQLAPTSSLKPVNGVISFGDRHYSVAEFNQRVNEAAEAGLI